MKFRSASAQSDAVGIYECPSISPSYDGRIVDVEHVKVYIDYVFKYSSSCGEHIEHVSHVLGVLPDNGLKLKLSKKLFAKERLELLGSFVEK